MARRNIVKEPDAVLHKQCREVTKFDSRLHMLLDDLRDTLATADGVGLAAPQVGVLRRVAIVLETNVEEGEPIPVIELVNPDVIECEGEQEGAEGCLSSPGQYALVKRPMKVKVRAQNRFGETFEVEGEGLTARCFCHEIDHLSGIVFTDLSDEVFTEDELEQE